MKIVLLLYLLCPGLLLANEVTLDMSDDRELIFDTVSALGDQLLLWLSSEFGYSPRQRPVAEVLVESGVEVWIIDLHSAYFIASGRYSLRSLSHASLPEIM